MSMDKAIEHGKEHRKPWRGSANSKNFDKTCRNHGSCDYCKFNRLHTFMKNRAAADDKLKEWEEQDIIWFVTYLFIFSDNSTIETVENFSYNPSQSDMEEVGYILADKLNATDFIASRGKKNWNGIWIDNTMEE